MSTQIPDPAGKPFGPPHRTGYSPDRLERLLSFLRKHPDATLASGEGALLLAEIERLRGQEGGPP